MRHARRFTLSLALLCSTACHAPTTSDVIAPNAASVPALKPPLPVVRAADELIAPGEKHFAHLWRLTKDVDNAAEAYWNPAGDALALQAQGRGVACDSIFTLGHAGAPGLRALSNGNGVTTCSYFMPDGASVLYASTHAAHRDCPPKPDMSRGYVWAVYPEYDIYVHDLASGKEHALTNTWGYDAEASVSPLGDRIVFTSTRSGDLELWTCALDGTDLRQVTDAPGYDGGAFFSHDGKWLVFRSTVFTPGKEAEEIAKHQATLRDWKVRPSRMEIMLVRPDGTERKQVTKLGGANFAPFFYPNDERIIFSTNHQDKSREARKFDLFACGLDGGALEQITTYDGFDCFPMFSPDGKWLVFASNRGGDTPEETNLYLAEWK
jgi:WD40 repeat protein